MRRIYFLGTGIGLDNPRTVCKSKFWLANIFFIFSASLLPPILIPDYRGKALILRITAVSKPFRTRFVNFLLPKSFQLVISTNAPPSSNVSFEMVYEGSDRCIQSQSSRFDWCGGCFILGSRQRRSTSNPLVSLKRAKNISSSCKIVTRWQARPKPYGSLDRFWFTEWVYKSRVYVRFFGTGLHLFESCSLRFNEYNFQIAFCISRVSIESLFTEKLLHRMFTR